MADHIIVLPGGGYAEHTEHEGQPVVGWLKDNGLSAGVFHYPLHERHPIPVQALHREIRRLRTAGAGPRVGLLGFSAGGHLAGHAALTATGLDKLVDFAILAYPITSMETDTYRPSQDILLGEDATPELRRSTSLDALVTPQAPPFFIWHTAEDPYVAPEHTYLLALSLARHRVPHTAHVFAHGPHSLGLAHGAGEVSTWTGLALRWIDDVG